MSASEILVIGVCGTNNGGEDRVELRGQLDIERVDLRALEIHLHNGNAVIVHIDADVLQARRACSRSCH